MTFADALADQVKAGQPLHLAIPAACALAGLSEVSLPDALKAVATLKHAAPLHAPLTYKRLTPHGR